MLRREAERRLVEQQQLAAGTAGRGRSRALLLAARQPAGGRRRVAVRRIGNRVELALDRPRRRRRGRVRAVAPSRRFSADASAWRRSAGPRAPARSRARTSRSGAHRRDRARRRSVIVPATGGTRPTIAESVVVLPAPFGPTSADDLAVADLERDAVQRGDAARSGRRGRRSRASTHAHAVARGRPRSPLGRRAPPPASPIAIVSPWSSTWMRSQRPHDHAHVVLDHEHAAAESLAAARRSPSTQLVALGLVEAGGGLVEEQEARLHGERARDLQPALLAGAAGRRPGDRPSSASAERARAASRGPRARLARVDADARPPPTSTFSSTVRSPNEPRRSGTCATMPRRAQPLGRQPGDVRRRRARTVPAVGCLEAREHVDQRRLAGAVRADQAEDLAGAQLEVDAVDRLDALEVDADRRRRASDAARPALDRPDRPCGRSASERHRAPSPAGHRDRDVLRRPLLDVAGLAVLDLHDPQRPLEGDVELVGRTSSATAACSLSNCLQLVLQRAARRSSRRRPRPPSGSPGSSRSRSGTPRCRAACPSSACSDRRAR